MLTFLLAIPKKLPTLLKILPDSLELLLVLFFSVFFNDNARFVIFSVVFPAEVKIELVAFVNTLFTLEANCANLFPISGVFENL